VGGAGFSIPDITRVEYPDRNTILCHFDRHWLRMGFAEERLLRRVDESLYFIWKREQVAGSRYFSHELDGELASHMLSRKKAFQSSKQRFLDNPALDLSS
jgi:hypothetical protein